MYLKNQKNSPSNIFSTEVLNKISVNDNISTYSTKYIAFLISLSLLIVALSKPVLNKEVSFNKAEITPLIIALDISTSMHTKDIYPSRLKFAKQKIQSIINNNKDIRVGLILFNFNAYIAYPLSEDLKSFEFVLNNLKFDSNTSSGTNLFSALEGSNQILRKYKTKNILLFSDLGIHDDFREEALYLKDNNLTLNTISFTQEKTEKLNDLVLENGGTYKKYSFGSSDVDSIIKNIKNSSKYNVHSTMKKEYKHLFYYPLSFSLLLFLFIIIYPLKLRNQVNGLILIFLVFINIDVNAGLLDFKNINDAKLHYESREYQKASTLYGKIAPNKEALYNLANSFYKRRKYKKAIATYKKCISKNSFLNAKSYHNMANAYFNMRNIKLAKKYYTLSIRISDDKKTKDNLEQLLEVEKNLKRKKKEEKYKLPQRMSIYVKEPAQTISSKYKVTLSKMILSEEDKWMKLIKTKKAKIFLQKLDTKRISVDATKNF